MTQNFHIWEWILLIYLHKCTLTYVQLFTVAQFVIKNRNNLEMIQK